MEFQGSSAAALPKTAHLAANTEQVAIVVVVLLFEILSRSQDHRGMIKGEGGSSRSSGSFNGGGSSPRAHLYLDSALACMISPARAWRSEAVAWRFAPSLLRSPLFVIVGALIRVRVHWRWKWRPRRRRLAGSLALLISSSCTGQGGR